MDRLFNRQEQIETQLAQEQEQLVIVEGTISATLQAQQILQDLAQLVQQRAHTQIARVVTRCLVAVFDKPYELRIIFEQSRGKTIARLVYFEGENEIEPCTTSGGVLDVASMALRLIVLVLSQPQSEKLLVLDEPMRMVDSENMPKMATLIETLSKEMNVQFVICTHNEALQIGKVVRL